MKRLGSVILTVVSVLLMIGLVQSEKARDKEREVYNTQFDILLDENKGLNTEINALTQRLVDIAVENKNLNVELPRPYKKEFYRDIED